MRKTVKLTARRECALKRLETRLSGVRKSTEKDFQSIGMTSASQRKEYMETHPYVFDQGYKDLLFYKEKDVERMKKEIDILKTRI